MGLKIVVVGGGISGLVAAYRLGQAGHIVTLVESARRPGGLIRTERRNGFLCEAGPQAMLDGAPEVQALIADLNLNDRIVTACPEAKKRFIYVRRKLRPVPTGPLSLLTTNLLSLGGKLRLVREPSVPPRPEDETVDAAADESVFEFGTRRLGPEAARALVAPGVLGIFAGDAARLSMRSAFPRIAAMERERGSLLRAMRAIRRQGGGAGKLVSFRDGLGELPAALVKELGPRLVTGRVEGLSREGARWVVATGGIDPGRLEAEAVVLATPPAATASLVDPFAAEAAAALRRIPLASVVVVCLGFDRARIGMNLESYGFLVARGERPTMLGCQYESTVFPDRAPEGSVLLRVIFGGTFDPGAIGQADEALVARALADLKQAAGLRVDPTTTAVFRHPDILPQYNQGHEALAGTVERGLQSWPHLHLVGQSLRGVGLSECIRNASHLADRFTARR